MTTEETMTRAIDDVLERHGAVLASLERRGHGWPDADAHALPEARERPVADGPPADGMAEAYRTLADGAREERRAVADRIRDEEAAAVTAAPDPWASLEADVDRVLGRRPRAAGA